MARSWKFREMGSRNKKTGKLSYYDVTEFRPYAPCKHMIRLKEKLSHYTI